ncbi:YybS family protein [Thermincola potens]|uniref:DUF2232 domain-containing protein n=1 Tax=Thermincola potens (strain JR) TaxID=635013 RepID=D5XDQ8_THEPJ|nr:YybS family protein [Thermincola potens]ADG83804.1 Protein of unknown function DUF2232, membrane [Thermincola potens JR]
MNQQRAVQPLAEGALLAALATFLGILSLGVPPVRFITDFLWGIPIIVIITKRDLRSGFMVLAVSLILLLFMFDPLTVFLFAIELSPMALCYGWLIKKKYAAGKSLIVGTVVAVAAEIVTILGFLYLAKIHIIPAKNELIRQVDEALALYKQFGLLDIYAKKGISESMLKDALYQSVELITLLIPAALILSAVMRAFLTWVVSQRVMRRLGFEVNGLPRFTEWQLPWYVIWFLIIGLVLTLTGDHFHIEKLAIMGKNTVFVISFVYTVIGLAITIHLMKNWKLPAWFKVFMVIIAILNLSGTLVLFALLGVFDSFVNFRRLGREI